MSIPFAQRESVEQVEEGNQLAPKFDEHGLLPVVTMAYDSRQVLMLGFMNEMALRKTIETGEAHYWSRSRQKLWRKGESSGLVQHVRQLLIDDDQDALVMLVDVAGSGASCHVGYKSCFYREIPVAQGEGQPLKFIESGKTFDPMQVYGNAPNPTKL